MRSLFVGRVSHLVDEVGDETAAVQDGLECGVERLHALRGVGSKRGKRPGVSRSPSVRRLDFVVQPCQRGVLCFSAAVLADVALKLRASGTQGSEWQRR